MILPLKTRILQSMAPNPKFKSLSHLDPALCLKTYNDLSTEEGQATEHTLTGPDSEASPPQKKSAIEELFGETFASKDADHHTFGGDPLAWWKSNQCKYPHIAMMARRYLAVPGTSVPSERVFSTAGDIVTAKRSTLSPENVDILIFVKKNLKL
ncbi:hypothetical protein VZT92_005546 [Zoarces viviparus]|uniref:HAT C-terminal dimerisation domain-containing protein n=1 Tax=Zoarces viviparus TaxID=48416 RepID=A0AAW1FST6_ZOAVI